MPKKKILCKQMLLWLPSIMQSNTNDEVSMDLVDKKAEKEEILGEASKSDSSNSKNTAGEENASMMELFGVDVIESSSNSEKKLKSLKEKSISEETRSEVPEKGRKTFYYRD